MTTASICTIGDEILIGQIVDTNSSHISRTLNSLGIKVNRMLSIGDDHNVIIEGLRSELEKNNIVIVTGGLGPTKDDITKQALAELSEAKGYYTELEASVTALCYRLYEFILVLLAFRSAEGGVDEKYNLVLRIRAVVIKADSREY